MITAEERLKDKLAMAAKEKLAMLERERTKREKEKIQAERKRKAAQFLASMKIVSSSSKNSNDDGTRGVNSEHSVLNGSLSNIIFKIEQILICLKNIQIFMHLCICV